MIKSETIIDECQKTDNYKDVCIILKETKKFALIMGEWADENVEGSVDGIQWQECRAGAGVF